MRLLLLVALTVTQSGCAWLNSLSNPVPLSVALATTERDLRATSPVALSDLGTTREGSIVAAIQAAQCIPPQSANPLVPVITGPVSLAMQGSIQAQGGVTGSATPSIAFQVTGGKQQQVTVPITFVSASGLPDFYMGQQLTNLSNLDSGGNDKTNEGARVSAGKTALVAAILDRREALKKLVAQVEKDFDTTVQGCKPDKYGNYSPPIIPQLQSQ
jgi:hypothetical protein